MNYLDKLFNADTELEDQCLHVGEKRMSEINWTVRGIVIGDLTSNGRLALRPDDLSGSTVMHSFPGRYDVSDQTLIDQLTAVHGSPHINQEDGTLSWTIK